MFAIKGNDSVVLCKLNGGENRTVESYFNPGRTIPVPVNLTIPSVGVSNQEMLTDGSAFTCSFSRQNAIPELAALFFPLDQEYYILFAQGKINNTNGQFNYHGRQTRLSSSSTYNILGASQVPDTNTTTNTTQGEFSSGPFKLTWTEFPKQTLFEYSVKTGNARAVNNYYVAIGFSDDQEMGNDDVVCCKLTNNVGEVEHLYNKDKSTPVWLSPTNAAIGITEAKVTADNGDLKCTFKREKSVAGVVDYFDLSAKTYYLLTGN
jgi:hypothetical protein